jgi:ketosteroid isomerase-like protein
MQSKDVVRALHTLDRPAIDNLIRSFWKQRLNDPSGALEQYFAPDAVLRLLGSPIAMGGPKTFEGLPAIIDIVRQIDTTLEFVSFTIIELLIDGNEVGCRWSAVFRNRGTGAVVNLGVFDHIVVVDGRIKSYSEYFDTDAFGRLMAGDVVAPIDNRGGRRRERPITNATFQPAVHTTAGLGFSRDEIEATLRAMWGDRVVFGSEAVGKYVTEDCVFEMIGDPAAVPFARLHRGKAAVLDLVRLIDMEFEFLSFAIVRIIVDGDSAAVEWHGDIRHRGTSAQGFYEAFDHVVFDGLLIKSYTEFFDTAGASRWIAG